jgi:uncharacterized membrane protein
MGSVWVAHHNLYGRLRCIDAPMTRLNLLLLMATAFLPFPTGLLAETLRSTDEASRTAVGRLDRTRHRHAVGSQRASRGPTS